MSNFLKANVSRIEAVTIDPVKEIDIAGDVVAAELHVVRGNMKQLLSTENAPVLMAILLLASFVVVRFTGRNPLTIRTAREWIQEHHREFPHLTEGIDELWESFLWAVAFNATWSPEEKEVLEKEMKEINFPLDKFGLKSDIEAYVFVWLQEKYGKVVR